MTHQAELRPEHPPAKANEDTLTLTVASHQASLKDSLVGNAFNFFFALVPCLLLLWKLGQDAGNVETCIWTGVWIACAGGLFFIEWISSSWYEFPYWFGLKPCRLLLTPDLAYYKSWFMPIHLLSMPADKELSTGLKFVWPHQLDTHAASPEFFLDSAQAHSLSQAFNAYLKTHAARIQLAARQTLTQAGKRLAPSSTSMFRVKWEKDCTIIERKRNGANVFGSFYITFMMVLFIVFMLLFLKPATTSWTYLHNEFRFFGKMLWALLGLMPYGLIFYLPIVGFIVNLFFNLREDLHLTRFELWPDRLVFDANRERVEIPWQEIEGFDYAETIGTRYYNNRISKYHSATLSLRESDWKTRLIRLDSQRRNAFQVVWLKDMLERSWHAAKHGPGH